MILRTFIILSSLVSIARAQTPVGARAETTPVPNSGDAADDPAIWVHPTDPSLSVIIGTDKQEGLAVYDLQGRQLQFLSDGEPNNVDLRKDFLLGGQRVTLVVASDRADNKIALYVLDATTRTLRDVAARNLTTSIAIYGCCMYRSNTGDYYANVTSKSGGFEQWRLFDNGSGKVDGLRVRTFDVGSDCEGCVADDELGFLFIGEEGEGVWRYGAEPGAGSTRISVDDTSGPNLTADVEGLSIYYAAGGKGYLLVSSQGDNTFSAYERQAPHRHVFNFEIVSSGSVDGVTDCDGIDVMNLSLGSAFPEGLFVAQDGSNSGGNQNFKLLSWKDIAIAASPGLLVDPVYDPHQPVVCATRASMAARNGSNPSLLTAQSMPLLGSTWRVNLDCRGKAGTGIGWLFAFELGGGGTNVFGAGELLVDPTSRSIFRVHAPHLGGNLPFNLAIPNSVALCGMTTTVQGLCTGGSQGLTNALDIVLGF